jgi:hypothetical protein
MLKYSDFWLQPLRNHKFKLIKDVNYRDLTIPKNFRTDGASVPRVFWCIYPPNRTDYLPCAVIHDYLCDRGEYKKADKYLKECLKEIGASKITIFTFYYAVRIYHKLRYKE